MSTAGPTPSEQAKARLPALKGRCQLGLADAQHDERDKLQQQARAVENQVDGDEALEGQLERQRPGKSAEQNADPRHAAAVASCDSTAGSMPIFGHGHGQAGVAHHQRIEHADAADGAAGDNAHAEQRTTDRVGRGHPVAGGEAVDGQAGERHGQQRQNVGDGDQHAAAIMARG